MTARFEDLTEDELIEWENRHDDIIAWEGMWRALQLIFLAIGLGLVGFTGQYLAGVGFVAVSLVFSFMRVRCIAKHVALDAERGQYIDE